MSTRDEKITSGRWINCEFQCPESLSDEEVHAIGDLLMRALMNSEWAHDCSVMTTENNGDFSFVIHPDYEFPKIPGR